MNYSDLINGIFETIGALMTTLSIIKLNIDKQVKGVSWIQVLYFSSWGLFNIWFYPHNGLLYSFLGGIFLATVNTVWLIQLIYYRYKK